MRGPSSATANVGGVWYTPEELADEEPRQRAKSLGSGVLLDVGCYAMAVPCTYTRTPTRSAHPIPWWLLNQSASAWCMAMLVYGHAPVEVCRVVWCLWGI